MIVRVMELGDYLLARHTFQSRGRAARGRRVVGGI